MFALRGKMLGYVVTGALLISIAGGNERSVEERLKELEALVAAQQQQIEHLKATLDESKKESGEKIYERTPTGKIVLKDRTPTAVEQKSNFISKLPFRFYGYLKADMAYDSDKVVSGNVARYVSPNAPANGDQISITANQSRFGFYLGDSKFVESNAYGRYEVDFFGSNSPVNKGKMRMRHAYVRWKNGDWEFTAGQTDDLIVQEIPKSIDFDYFHYRGKIGFRTAQFAAAKTLDLSNGTFKPAVALSRPVGSDLDRDGQEDGVDSGIPNIQWVLPFKLDVGGIEGLKISTHGHWGTERIEKVGNFLDGNLETWSFGMTLNLPLGERWSLKGNVWTGANLDFYLGGVGQGVNSFLGDVIEASGGWLQFGYVSGSRWEWYFGGGIDDPKDADLNSGMRSSNWHFATELFYDLPQGVRLGVEWEHLETGYLGGEDASADRLQGTIIYSF